MSKTTKPPTVIEVQSSDVAKKPDNKFAKGFMTVIKSRIFFVIVVIILAAIPSVYFYTHGPTKKIIGDLQTVDQVVEAVDKHYLLPIGESPTMATVTDVNRVKSQAFFASASNGDKVLVYSRARKAILYRPSIDKIIEVAPLEIGKNP